MRTSLCILALAGLAWAGDTDNPPPADKPEQAQTGTTDQTKPPEQPPPPAALAPADAPAAPKLWHGYSITGLADGYFTFNSNHPASGANQLQNFDLHYGQPELSLAKITIDKSDQKFGFHVDAGFGETMRLVHATDPAPHGFSYIEQMYLIAKPNHVHGAEFNFGEFVTWAGAEVIESTSNWNYSRSLLFAWAIPYYHFGFRSTVPITKSFTAGVAVVNGWNNLWDNNKGKTLGLMTAYTKTKFAWTNTYYAGPEHSSTNDGWRNLYDTVLTLTPNSKSTFYINYDYGRDNRIGGGHDSWYGLAGAARFQLTKTLALAARAEWFDDAAGFSTGTQQKLKEGTLTGEYKYSDHLIGRLEFRHDASDQPFFDRGAQVARSKDMNTFSIGMMVLLGPMREK